MVDSVVEASPTVGTRAGLRAVVAASVGNLFEWYDFTVYAFFAVYIGGSFFPSDNPDTDLIKSFLAYGVGFIARPVGAVLIGQHGDRVGRKAALMLTIMLMAAGTLLIAIAPTYAAIGLGAPLILLAGRLLQGLSAGGEIGGATAFLMEHAPVEKRGIFASWLQATMAMSNILGAVIGLSVTALLDPQQMSAFGWRIPFLVGLLIAPIGLYLRRTLEETPIFMLAMEQAGRRPAGPGLSPVLGLLRDDWRTLLAGFGISVLWAAAPFSLIIPMPAYAQHTLHYSGTDSFAAALISDVVLVAACFAAGALSDRIGRRRVLALAAFTLLVVVAPLFYRLQSSHALLTLTLVQCGFCLATGLYLGVAPAGLSEIFPARTRATGIALSYTAAVVGLGAFAPAVQVWLTHILGGAALVPAWYVMLAAVGSLIAIRWLPQPRE